jgi:hypothetical protein
MASQDPDISDLRDGLCRQRRHVIRIGKSLGKLRCELLAFRLSETDQFQVKAKDFQFAIPVARWKCRGLAKARYGPFLAHRGGNWWR